MSLLIAKRPARVILLTILLVNMVFFIVAGIVIYNFTSDAVKEGGFLAAIFYTISMVLDAGCIQYVIDDAGQVGFNVIVICLITVLAGSVIFTGAVIGYVTNYISSFIEDSAKGKRPLNLSDHVVFLNWNSRAAGMISEFYRKDNKAIIVILVKSGKDRIESEIADHMANELRRDLDISHEEEMSQGWFRKWRFDASLRKRSRLSIIVREGDTFLSNELRSISLAQAKAIIILDRDNEAGYCRFEREDDRGLEDQGSINAIKTLIQAIKFSGSDEQRIAIEIEEDWTQDLVDEIINTQTEDRKNNTIPLNVNKSLGNILAQFSIMPDLSVIYDELFSNYGSSFYSLSNASYTSDEEFVTESLAKNDSVLPLSLKSKGPGSYRYYVAETPDDVSLAKAAGSSTPTVMLNENFWLERRRILILGHNSRIGSIMEGFNAFSHEWSRDGIDIATDGKADWEIGAVGDVLDITVIDEASNLKKADYYREYPYVNNTVEANMFDKDIIYENIRSFLDGSGIISILILSNDKSENEAMDAQALTYLIYVQDVLRKRREAIEAIEFKHETIDVIVEILNPKNYDVMKSHNAGNVVISNRYISKLMIQIALKGGLAYLYDEILTYDIDGEASKEVYVKKSYRYFAAMPPPMTGAELVRAVYKASPPENKTVLLGYVNEEREVSFFTGANANAQVRLTDHDKLILYSNH
jgi:hypothetical protein